MPETFCFEVPVATVTESNTGGHWATKNRRAKNQKNTTRAAWLAARAGRWLCFQPVSHVRLVRRAPGKLDDDNLPSAMKHIRDELAVLLGLTPVIQTGKKKGQYAYGVGDDRIPWEYAQEVVRGAPPCVVVALYR